MCTCYLHRSFYTGALTQLFWHRSSYTGVFLQESLHRSWLLGILLVSGNSDKTLTSKGRPKPALRNVSLCHHPCVSASQTSQWNANVGPCGARNEDRTWRSWCKITFHVQHWNRTMPSGHVEEQVLSAYFRCSPLARNEWRSNVKADENCKDDILRSNPIARNDH